MTLADGMSDSSCACVERLVDVRGQQGMVRWEAELIQLEMWEISYMIWSLISRINRLRLWRLGQRRHAFYSWCLFFLTLRETCEVLAKPDERAWDENQMKTRKDARGSNHQLRYSHKFRIIVGQPRCEAFCAKSGYLCKGQIAVSTSRTTIMSVNWYVSNVQANQYLILHFGRLARKAR